MKPIVEWTSSNQEDYSRLFQKGVQDNFQRLNHYTTSNPGKVIPADLYDRVQEGQGDMAPSKNIVIKTITPSQQALEIAKSELKHEVKKGKGPSSVYKKKSKRAKPQSTKKSSSGKTAKKRSSSQLTPFEQSAKRKK